MSARFFLDTNIFVYAFDARSPEKANRATELIKLAVSSRQGIISYQVVQEFFNVAIRRFAQPMQCHEAKQYLATIFVLLSPSTRLRPSTPRRSASIPDTGFRGMTRLS